MNVIQTVVMALCLWCSAATPSVAASHTSEECFQSVQQTRQVHKEGHIWHHTTPNGMCYHVGPRNHSGTFTTQSPSPSPIGSNTSRIKEDWGSKAKPVKYGIALDVGEARQTLGKNWPNYHGAFWELMK